MSGKRRGWSDTIFLLGQQSKSKSQPLSPIPNQNSSFSLSPRNSAPAVCIEMASTAAASLSDPLRTVFLGVDVGTGSARAGLFDENGKLLGSSSSSIQIWKDGDCIEQSSTDIWHAVCAAVKAACSSANVAGEEVKGIGFAATCSLVAVDSDGSPVSVSWSGDSRRNIIVWMDHRAVEQAERINSFHSPVLEYCGGALSPEMQPPKLLWVKENLLESWSMVFKWMDLSDWLSYRATGDDTRSLCTTVCKWTYLGHAHMQQNNENDSRDMEACGWDDDFWEEIGLGDLVDGHHAKIGRSVAFPGHPLGSGLTPAAAKELDLVAGIPVGTSLIDAHAGGVGVMESVPVSDSEHKEDDNDALCHRMVLVCGTSTCHMSVSRSKLFIPGVWGPFWSAMVPEYWLTEGGQSATGALLDHIIQNHAGSPHLANRAASRHISVFELLNQKLETMKHDLKLPFVAALTEETHVLPDFHGNRSPIADPKAKGMVSGLTLDTSEKQLALLYLATIQGIAYGTRHIVEHCNAHGHKINTILACGGLSKNPLYIQEHADIIGSHQLVSEHLRSMGRISVETHLGERLTALETKIESRKESISFLRSATDPIPKIQGDLSVLKVQTTAMASKLIAMRESMSRMEDMGYRQFGENHRSVTGRFSENYFQNSSLGVDRDRNEHSDKRLKMQLFRGDDPFGWLFRADRFFALNGIEEGEKIYVASLYLLGPALKWFIGIDAHTSFPSWKAFRSAVQQRFGRVFPIDNSDGVPGRDRDEKASCKSDDVNGLDRDEESCCKSGEVRESSQVFSGICTEVAVAGDEDEDAVADERLKMNKILGQIWKVGVGWVSCFKDPLTLAAQLEGPASFLSPKVLSPSWQPTSHTPVTATSFGSIGAGVDSLLQRQFLAYFRCQSPAIMAFLGSFKECFQGVQLLDGLVVPVAIPWLWKRRKKSAIAVHCYRKFEKKFSNWIFHNFKEKKRC